MVWSYLFFYIWHKDVQGLGCLKPPELMGAVTWRPGKLLMSWNKNKGQCTHLAQTLVRQWLTCNKVQWCESTLNKLDHYLIFLQLKSTKIMHSDNHPCLMHQLIKLVLESLNCRSLALLTSIFNISLVSGSTSIMSWSMTDT